VTIPPENDVIHNKIMWWVLTVRTHCKHVALLVSDVAGSWREWDFNRQEDTFPSGRIDPHHSKISHSFDRGWVGVWGGGDGQYGRLVKFLDVC
jgi:hypothetical protein